MTATEPTSFTDALRATFLEGEVGTEQAGGEGDAGDTESIQGETASTETTTPTPEKYKVKVDGQEQEVTLDEALAGYQRQSTFTQRTQELAAEKQRLQQAEAIFDLINENPKAALAQLAEYFDVEDFSEESEELDPLERDVKELKSFADQQRALQQQAEVDAEFAALQAKFKDTEIQFDDLLRHAIETNASSLELAYTNLKAPEWTAAIEAKRASEDAAVEAAKQAANIVSGGTDRSSSGTTTEGGGRPRTVREAFDAALEESKA